LLPQERVIEYASRRRSVCVFVCEEGKRWGARERKRKGGVGRRKGLCVRKRGAPVGASWDSGDTMPCRMAGVITPAILNGTIPLGPLGSSSS